MHQRGVPVTYRGAGCALEPLEYEKKTKSPNTHNSPLPQTPTQTYEIDQPRCTGLLIAWTVAVRSGANLSSTLFQNIGVSRLPPSLPPPLWLFLTVSPRGDISIRNVTGGDSLFHFHHEILLVECLWASTEGAALP